VRRADRLFQIIQRLRRRGVTTAAQLAEALEVSERTIYRDIRDLAGSGVPILGEAGVGYALPRGYDLPPLMFTEEELEALLLGARLVQRVSDSGLARAAEDALGKIRNVLPERLSERFAETKLFAPSYLSMGAPEALGPLRAAIRELRRVRFSYQSREDAKTRRTVRPLGLFCWGRIWSLGAWCELRQDFRTFRIDRMNELELKDTFALEPGRTVQDLMRKYSEQSRDSLDR
jgi:predicted DNA-binding transcriptional regulator YafY